MFATPDWWLGLVVWLPLATALLLLAVHAVVRFFFVGDGLPVGVWRVTALLGALATLLACLFVWLRFDPERSGHQMVEHLSWLPSMGIHYFLGVDGISLLFISLTSFLVPLALLARRGPVEPAPRTFLVCVLAFETGALGALLSLDLFLFYLFSELLLLPMAFLIGLFGGAHRVQAALRSFLFAGAGSLLLLFAMLVLVRLNHAQMGELGFDFLPAPDSDGVGLIQTYVPVHAGPWWQTQAWLFGCFTLAFGLKLPLLPLHRWLPPAHEAAPVAASVLLGGVWLQIGAYGLLRFAFPLFPAAAADAVPWLITVGVVGVLYGGLVAMVQRDLKQSIAYAQVAQAGFVLVGLFTLNRHGMTGAVVHAVSVGLVIAVLYVLAGFLIERRGTAEISEFGGLAKPMPVFTALFGTALLALLGLPALSGFVGEFLVLLGAFATKPWLAALTLLGAVIAAVHGLTLLRRITLGPLERPENRGLIDLDLREKLVVLTLLAPILWIGLYPNPLMRRVEPAVSLLLRQMEARIEIEELVLPELASEDSATLPRGAAPWTR